ncbi:methyltransferase-UbiE family protein [Xylariaceae sp. FL0016]|nr:methyltransferase-UbiE family protein [Xylariaceae sp. FL0016]
MDVRKYNSAMVDSYSVRTAATHASYILPRIKPDMKILDVGCGPGTITVDLASRVPEGSVTGLDAGEMAIEKAKGTARERGIANVTFVLGDAFNLPFEDNTFDLVHCHQVLVHLPSHEGQPGPLKGLSEMRRVCKVGAIVCAKEAEWDSRVVFPKIPGVREALDLMLELSLHRSVVLHGCRMREFARKAGFEADKIEGSASVTTYSGREQREWAGENMAKRIESGNTKQKALELGLATQEEVERMAPGWREWAKHDDAFYSLTDAQIICFK